MESVIRPYLEAGRFLQAQKAIQTVVVSLHRPTGEQLAEAAYWSCQANDFNSAAKWYRQASELSPDHPTYHYNLATTCRITGDIHGAQQALARHLTKHPDDAEAYWLRVQLGKQTGSEQDIQVLNTLTSEDNPPKQRVHAWYALGKVHEDTGDDEACFNAFQAGADLRRRYLKYDIANDQAIMQAIAGTFTRQWFESTPTRQQGAGNLFIVGMPRSGTTLVENLLGAHEGVAMGGELNAFSSAMMAQVTRSGQPASVKASIKRAAECDYIAMGQSYRQAVRDYHQGKQFLTDKLPLNFLYVGLIKKALPGAKILHIQRNPMDTVWSVYKHLFSHTYPFSYRLDEIADYYIAYRALMSHWESLPGSQMMTIKYESLVSQPGTTMRSVADYCEIPFDAACLNFYQHNMSVTTGSAVQVREPVNSRSIGQWQRYSAQLAGVREKLTRAGLLDET